MYEMENQKLGEERSESCNVAWQCQKEEERGSVTNEMQNEHEFTSDKMDGPLMPSQLGIRRSLSLKLADDLLGEADLEGAMGDASTH